MPAILPSREAAVSCGITHKKKTTHVTGYKNTAARAAAAKKAAAKRKGTHLTLAQRKAISEALQCYYAAHGTCKTPKKNAHKAKVIRDAAHGYRQVTTCTAVASGFYRRAQVTPRNTGRLRRQMMLEIQHAQFIARRQALPRYEHLTVTRPSRVAARAARRPLSSRPPRQTHADRVSCHTAWRRVTTTGKPRASLACPKRKSRLDGK
jgi:hypothetical protein